jgi:hypothetical protein
MIWQLMRRDPAWRMTLWTTPGVAVTYVLCHFLAPVEINGGDPAVFLLTIFLGFLGGLMAVFTETSDTDFQATLPVTVRQVFLSRILSMTPMMMMPVVTGVAILTALKDPIPANSPLELWTPLVCTLLGIQCFSIRQNIRQWLIIVLLPAWIFICAVAGMGGLLNVGSGTAVAARVVCWAIIAAVVWRTWQVLPLSFQDASMEVAAALPVRRAMAARKSGAPSWKSWLHIALMTSSWTYIPAFFMALMIGTSNPFLFIWLGLQWKPIGRPSRWLSALPVSPRILISAAALPTLLAICGGDALNIHDKWFRADNVRGVSVRHSQEPECKTPNVLPTLEYWIPIRSGKAPLIDAPWGETFQPPVNRVMGFDIYDPYAVGCDNSRRFLEWQFNRATVAIYGRSIPLDKKVDPGVKQTAISALRTQVVAIASLMAFSLLSLLIAMTFDWHRMRRLPEVAQVGAKCLVGAAAAALFLWVDVGDINLIQWISWTLPANTAAAIAVEFSALAVLVLGVDRLFRKLEFTDKPVRGSA